MKEKNIPQLGFIKPSDQPTATAIQTGNED
jgi:hypothetical protein